jgi:hypothetical protein
MAQHHAAIRADLGSRRKSGPLTRTGATASGSGVVNEWPPPSEGNDSGGSLARQFIPRPPPPTPSPLGREEVSADFGRRGHSIVASTKFGGTVRSTPRARG